MVKTLRFAVGDRERIRLHAGSASHGDEEFGELIAGAALALEDVIGIVDLAKASCLVFGALVLASEVRVLNLHDGCVNLAKLLIGGVRRGDDLVNRGRDLRTRAR